MLTGSELVAVFIVAVVSMLFVDIIHRVRGFKNENE